MIKYGYKFTDEDDLSEVVLDEQPEDKSEKKTKKRDTEKDDSSDHTN